MKVGAYLLPFALCCCAVSPVVERESLSPSEINRESATHAGQRVRIEGYLVHAGGEYGIWNNASSYDSNELGSCVTPFYGADMRAAVVSKHGKRVLVTGKYVADISSRDMVYTGNCSLSAIRISDIEQVE